MRTEEQLYSMNEFLFSEHRRLKDALSETTDAILFSIVDDLDTIIEMIKAGKPNKDVISAITDLKNTLV